MHAFDQFQTAHLGVDHGAESPCGTDGGNAASFAEGDEGHVVVQRLHLPGGAGTAAEFARTPAVGHQRIAVDDDGIGILQQFHIAAGQRTKAALRPAGVPTVLAGRGPRAADDGGQHHRHIFLVVAFVPAGDVQPVGMAPACRNLGRHRLFKGQPHGIGQCLHRRCGAVHVRRGFGRIADRALRPHVDADAAIEPLVIRRRQLGKHHQAQIDAGIAVPFIAVDEIGDLRRRRDFDMAIVTADGDLCPDLEIAKAVACVFQNGAALIGAVGHCGDQPAHLPFGHVQQGCDAGIHGLFAVFLQHGDQGAFANLTGPDQRVEITLLVTAGAHVGEDEVQDILAWRPPVPDLDGRNAQAFGVDFPCVGVIACRHRAADIREVALADRPVFQATFPEHRFVKTGVDGMAAAPGRIIVDQKVALVDIAPEISRHHLHRRDQGPKVNGNVLPLQDHLGRGVEQRG